MSLPPKKKYNKLSLFAIIPLRKLNIKRPLLRKTDWPLRGDISPDGVSSYTVWSCYHQSLISSGYWAKPYQPIRQVGNLWKYKCLRINHSGEPLKTPIVTRPKNLKEWTNFVFFLQGGGGGLGFRSHIYPTVQPLSTQGLGRGKRFDYFITVAREREGEGGAGRGEVAYKLTYTRDWSLFTIWESSFSPPSPPNTPTTA